MQYQKLLIKYKILFITRLGILNELVLLSEIDQTDENVIIDIMTKLSQVLLPCEIIVDELVIELLFGDERLMLEHFKCDLEIIGFYEIMIYEVFVIEVLLHDVISRCGLNNNYFNL